MGREVEGDGKPFLPRGEVAAIESVGLFGGRETGVLADGPRLGGVHGGARAANVRRQAGQGAGHFQIIKIGFGIQRLNVNALCRLFYQGIDGFFPPAELFVGERLPLP